jgi:hypothetical protein
MLTVPSVDIQGWTLQKRPTGRNQNMSIYTLRVTVRANFFAALSDGVLYGAYLGGGLRHRMDATGAPTQQPEWLGRRQPLRKLNSHSGAKR